MLALLRDNLVIYLFETIYGSSEFTIGSTRPRRGGCPYCALDPNSWACLTRETVEDWPPSRLRRLPRGGRTASAAPGSAMTVAPTTRTQTHQAYPQVAGRRSQAGGWR